jgi:hypothetical protein
VLSALVGEQGGGDEQRRGGGGPRPSQDLGGGGVVATDQPAEQVLDVIGHETTIEVGPDGVLTLS